MHNFRAYGGFNLISGLGSFRNKILVQPVVVERAGGGTTFDVYGSKEVSEEKSAATLP